MNNHQNAIFHQITNFLKTPLALLGVDLKNFQFNKICHFANHPYLCKGLFIKIGNGYSAELLAVSLSVLPAAYDSCKSRDRNALFNSIFKKSLL
ncbi:hypothetical protein [Candidatus Thiodubiliella endoseptemdiera]|uniref:Uncharacterized protein n=1 Tax=Candidatus Thiodubiliella endoseptemdiera TaxID=2738886 RepID=A0A853EYE9_9GAMM|nr:hypothetical protein [Candidatus Thiodubiliella endoseptemdiera]